MKTSAAQNNSLSKELAERSSSGKAAANSMPLRALRATSRRESRAAEKAISAATSEDDAADRPSMKMTAPKPVSLESHSVTLSNRPARGEARIGQPLIRTRFASHHFNSAMQAPVSVTGAFQLKRRSRREVARRQGREAMTRSISRVRTRVATPVETHVAAIKPLICETERTPTVGGPARRAEMPDRMQSTVAGGTEYVCVARSTRVPGAVNA